MSIKVYPAYNLDVYPPLNSYEEGSFTVTATGFSGTAPSGTAYYTRVGKQVTLTFPALSATSNSATFTLLGLPSQLIQGKVANFAQPIRAIDNSISILGWIFAQNDGIFGLATTPAGAGWVASGQKGIYESSLSYNI